LAHFNRKKVVKTRKTNKTGFSGFFSLSEWLSYGHTCGHPLQCAREGVYPVDNSRRVEMVNWTALLGLVHGVAVRKTSRHWIVYVESLYGRHPGELFSLWFGRNYLFFNEIKKVDITFYK